MSALVKNAQMLTRYRAWTNQLIYEAIGKLLALETSHCQTDALKKIMRNLNHIVIVDLIWKAHLTGQEHGFTERSPLQTPSFLELRSQQTKIDSWYQSWSAALTEEQLQQKINFTLIGGKKGQMTRNEILLHVVNHTSYHRGMIATGFFEFSLKPPATDLTIFFDLANEKNF